MQVKFGAKFGVASGFAPSRPRAEILQGDDQPPEAGSAGGCDAGLSDDSLRLRDEPAIRSASEGKQILAGERRLTYARHPRIRLGERPEELRALRQDLEETSLRRRAADRADLVGNGRQAPGGDGGVRALAGRLLRQGGGAEEKET